MAKRAKPKTAPLSVVEGIEVTDRPGAYLNVDPIANPNQATVYEGASLVATLRREGSGWVTAWFKSGETTNGRTAWTKGPDQEPMALNAAADRTLVLVTAARDAATQVAA